MDWAGGFVCANNSTGHAFSEMIITNAKKDHLNLNNIYVKVNKYTIDIA